MSFEDDEKVANEVKAAPDFLAKKLKNTNVHLFALMTYGKNMEEFENARTAIFLRGSIIPLAASLSISAAEHEDVAKMLAMTIESLIAQEQDEILN